MRKKLTVSGIESAKNRIMLLEDVGRQYPVKYSFFMSWDNEPTDVYTQFNDLGVRIGQTYDVEVVEKDGKNAGGKPVVYRNITKFYSSSEPQECSDDGYNINEPESRMDKMAKWAKNVSISVEKLQREVKELQAEVAGLSAGDPGTSAYDLHKSMDTPLRNKIDPTIPVVDINDEPQPKDDCPF